MSGKTNPATAGGFRLTLRRGLETHVRAKLFCDVGIEPVVVELTKAVDPDDPFRKQPDVFINDALNENASTLIQINTGKIIACKTGDLAGNMDKEIQVIGYTVTLAGMHISMQEANIYLQATVKTADGLDMTGVIIEQHSPPMGAPFPVEKRITTNFHQSFVPPKSAFTMFPPRRKGHIATAPVAAPTIIAEKPRDEERTDPLSDLSSEFIAEGLLDPTHPTQPPTNLEGGEAMTTTNKPFPFEVFGEVDELDVDGRFVEMWVTKGNVSPTEPLAVLVEVRQPKETKVPERHHKRFQPETEGGRWMVRRIPLKATIPGTVTVKSPAGLFNEFVIQIRNLGEELPPEAPAAEKTEVNFVRPDFEEGSDVASAALKTQEDPPRPRPLPQPVPEESGSVDKPKKVARTSWVAASADGDPVMPPPTMAAPASSDGFEDAPKTKEMQNPAVSAALLDSLASQDDLVQVPPEAPKIAAKIEELRDRRESLGFDIPAPTMQSPQTLQPPAPMMPKPAVRMGPAPPPPTPAEPAMATSTAEPLEALFEGSMSHAVISPEPPLTAPPIPHDHDAEEVDELAKELEPVQPAPRKLSLVERHERKEPAPEPKPQPEPQPEQKPPSPPPGAKENRMPEEKKSGTNLVALVIAVVIAVLAGGGGVYFLTKDDDKPKGDDEKEETLKGHAVEGDKTGDGVIDERDDQYSDKELTEKEKHLCKVVIIVDGKRKAVDIDEWHAAYDKDEAYGASHPISYHSSGRPVVAVLTPGEKVPEYYIGTFDKNWRVRCENVRTP